VDALSETYIGILYSVACGIRASRHFVKGPA
jgi:hypothetical protein